MFQFKVFDKIRDIIEFVAKVGLIDDTGRSSALCDPLSPQTVMRCPSASIIGDHGVCQTAAFWDFAQVRGNWSVTEWNVISGSVVVDDVLAAADSLAILITRCRKTVRIILNDVSAKIRQQDLTCRELIRDGSFKDHGLAGWSLMGESMKAVVDGGVLHLSGRQQWYYGIAQILSSSCFAVGSEFEVHAKLRLVNKEGFVTCEPGRLYLSPESCPNI